MAEARLAAEELISLAAGRASGSAADSARENALACFLSGGDGWNEAGKSLRGAFSAAAILDGRKD